MNKYEEALHSIKSKLDRSKHDVAVYEQKLAELKHQSLLAEYEDKYVILAGIADGSWLSQGGYSLHDVDVPLEEYYRRNYKDGYHIVVATMKNNRKDIDDYVFTKKQVDQFVKNFPRPKLAQGGVIPFKDSQLVSQLLYLVDKEESK